MDAVPCAAMIDGGLCDARCKTVCFAWCVLFPTGCDEGWLSFIDFWEEVGWWNCWIGTTSKCNFSESVGYEFSDNKDCEFRIGGD